MTLEMWLTLGILAAAIVLFVTEWLRVDVVALGVVVALMLVGVLTTGEALAGFASTAVLTIASLFIVGGAVLNTGLAAMLGRRILRVAGTSELRLTVIIMLAVAVMSGFMSDTGVVAVMLPALISLAGAANIAPSKLLIPLAYGSLLGGASTLIGTPPNIIVTDLLQENGLRPFEFFSFTPMGAILIVAGVVYMALIGRQLLPDRRRKQHDIQRVETPEELVELYRLPDNLYRLRVRRRSPLIGETIAGSQLGAQYGLNVLEVRRKAATGPPRLAAEPQASEGPDGMRHILSQQNPSLMPDDVLIVQGPATAVSQAAARWNLAILPAPVDEPDTLITDEIGIAEVVLPPRSSLIGRTLRDLRFGSRYHLTVLAIRRPGSDEPLDLKDTPLRFGDTLLVQGSWTDILALRRQRRDFVVMGEPEATRGAPNRPKAPIALAILAGMLVLMVTELISVTAASMLAGLAMVLTGCLTMDEAYEAIDWKSVVLVAGMLPMATALEKVGLVGVAATGLTSVLGGLGPQGILAGLFLLTSIFTQVLSNTATTVLVAPIALATAQSLGVSPYPLLMAVAIGASTAFGSPVASPVNTLVMGAGSYRFSDYIKAGVPMILLVMAVTVLVLPLLWPF